MPLKRRKEVNHERERRKPANPVDTRTNPGRTRRNPERTHRDWETLATRVGDGTLADPAEERMDDPGFRLWLHFAHTPRTMNPEQLFFRSSTGFHNSLLGMRCLRK